MLRGIYSRASGHARLTSRGSKFHTQTSRNVGRVNGKALALASTVAMSGALWYANAQAEIIHNDAPGAVTFETKPDKLAKNSLEDEDLSLLVWGSNK